uniref:Uncharacterized protein n=1 Tax=Anguilla anguilla TaxID=7936 RepID=A0A0E9UDN6_ANGAN
MLVKGPRHGVWDSLGSLKKCWHDGYDGWVQQTKSQQKIIA